MTDCVLSIIHSCQLESRRKCESILSMRHQVFVVSEQTGRGGIVCFPWLSVWRNFYSKADCTVSGCLYTISIIMEGEGPLLHASPLCDNTSSPASLWSFFFIHYSGRLFFHQVYRRGQCVFDCSIHLPDSFIRLHGGYVYVQYIVQFVTAHWRHAVCVCNPSWLQPVTRILQEEMAECGRDSLSSHMEFCFGL